MSETYSGGYPVADYGPNDFTRLVGPLFGGSIHASHYLHVNKECDGLDTASNPATGTQINESWLQATVTGKIEKFRFVDKPQNVDVATEVRIRMIQFATGFLSPTDLIEFPIT